jgi:intracellular multiplication protein IcmL
VHWREQLQDASNNFTPFGWRYFLKSLQASNNLTTVQKLKMVESAQVTGAPEIIRKGVVSGHYMWAVKLPILLTYTNINKTINQAMMVTLIVLRQPVQDMPSGVGINNFLANDS